MKCRQIFKSMNNYFSEKVSKKIRGDLEKNVDICSQDKADLWISESIIDDINSAIDIKAPNNFTNNVMREVSKLNINHSKGHRSLIRKNYAPAFNRLGTSMIITAAIMLLMLFKPLGLYDMDGYYESKVKAVVWENNNHTISLLGHINAGVQSIFGMINQSIGKFKEV